DLTVTGVQTCALPISEVMPDNRPMLSVFQDAGFAVSRRLEGGTTEVRLAIEPTESYRAAVDERDHVAVAASLRPFFSPRTVAVRSEEHTSELQSQSNL